MNKAGRPCIYNVMQIIEKRQNLSLDLQAYHQFLPINYMWKVLREFNDNYD